MNEHSDFINTSLDSINSQSEKNAYTADDINWSLKVDPTKKWMPDSLLSISHLPVFEEFSPELKLLFNQFNALGAAEMFVFFEETALVASMEQALKMTRSQSLKTALVYFIEEEKKHSVIFKRLLESARPDLYSEKNFKHDLIRLNLFSRFITYGIRRFPALLPSWVWIAIFFEERTVLYSREYISAYKKQSGNVDELFYQAHFFHMKDEVRHVKLDEHMIENFYKTFGSWHAKLTAYVVQRFVQRSAYPKKMMSYCIKNIKKEAPHLLTPELENKIFEQLKQLSITDSFKQLNFGPEAAPRTRILMNQFPEFKNFWQKIMNPVG